MNLDVLYFSNSVFFRIALSALLGAIIGIDRVMKKRPAGFKTHALVSMGASLVMLTGEYLVQLYGAQTDVARLAAQVVSGVGFLGAGTIMVTGRSQIKGLTTAAGLWFAATLGLAIGIGFYEGVIGAVVFYFIVMRVFALYDNYLQKNSFILDAYVEYDQSTSFGKILKKLKNNDYRIVEVERMGDFGQRHLVNLSIRIPNRKNHQEAIRFIESIDGVTLIEEI